jgi:hypothetical protein
VRRTVQILFVKAIVFATRVDASRRFVLRTFDRPDPSRLPEDEAGRIAPAMGSTVTAEPFEVHAVL